jgi:hypothetical protein
MTSTLEEGRTKEGPLSMDEIDRLKRGALSAALIALFTCPGVILIAACDLRIHDP